MIALHPGARIWIAAGIIDLRRRFTGLSAAVQIVLEQDPFGGHAFVFRGRRGGLVRLLWWDGGGYVCFRSAWNVDGSSGPKLKPASNALN